MFEEILKENSLINVPEVFLAFLYIYQRIKRGAERKGLSVCDKDITVYVWYV